MTNTAGRHKSVGANVTAVEMDGKTAICGDGAVITVVVEAESEFETLSTEVAIDSGFVPDDA